MGAESQGFEPSSTAFPGHKQGAGWEMELQGLELVPIWDPGTFKMITLTATLLHRVPQIFFFLKRGYFESSS